MLVYLGLLGESLVRYSEHVDYKDFYLLIFL